MTIEEIRKHAKHACERYQFLTRICTVPAIGSTQIITYKSGETGSGDANHPEY
jgi:hypothetical protein